MSDKWQGPSTNASFATAGGLFTSLAGVCAPAEEKPHKVLVALEESVNGKTPGRVLEDMNAGMDQLASAGAKYGVCATGYAKIQSAMATWTKEAPSDEHLNGLIDARAEAKRSFDDAVDQGDDEQIDARKKVLDGLNSDISREEAKRVAADQALTGTLNEIETWISSSAQSIGVPADVLKGKDSAPSAPGGNPGGTPSAPGGTPGTPGAPAPRVSPSGVPGSGDLPGTAPEKNPAVEAALKKLLAENPSNAQVQQPQAQPAAATSPAMSTPGTQTKPTEKGKSESPLDRMLREAGITPPTDATPDLVAAVVPGGPTTAPAPATQVAPPAPKAQVGGSSYSNGTTSANTSGGQNRAPMVLSSAPPVQETVNPGQRTGTQTPMGHGMPMGPLGGQGQPSAGKEQPRVQLYIKKSETELVASGAYAIDEAVRGGTLCRGDHADEDENKGPRKR